MSIHKLCFGTKINYHLILSYYVYGIFYDLLFELSRFAII